MTVEELAIAAAYLGGEEVAHLPSPCRTNLRLTQYIATCAIWGRSGVEGLPDRFPLPGWPRARGPSRQDAPGSTISTEAHGKAGARRDRRLWAALGAPAPPKEPESRRREPTGLSWPRPGGGKVRSDAYSVGGSRQPPTCSSMNARATCARPTSWANSTAARRATAHGRGTAAAPPYRYIAI
jgi:hypothetical protein